MGVNIGKPGLRNIFITKSVPNLPNESKFTLVGRSPDKLGSKQLCYQWHFTVQEDMAELSRQHAPIIQYQRTAV